MSAVLLNGLKVSIENPAIPFPAEQLEKRISELKARIIDLKTEERSVNPPPPPYTTDTLLRDASIKLGFSATKTMIIAQDSFEMAYARTTEQIQQGVLKLEDGNQTLVENPVRILSEGFNTILPIKTAIAVQEGEYPLKFAKLLYLPAARPFT
ncbi:MAG: DNA topoisomerase [Nitrososphaerota archaeon]|nr:DNA topoisomerase [Nitrososphaerota archaeon]